MRSPTQNEEFATATSPAQNPRPSQATASDSLDKSNDRVREMFRQIAPRYDAMNHLLSMNVDKYWRWQAVRRLRWQPSFPILDVCTGTGDLALAIAAATDETVEVVGSDFCHAMLEIAQGKSHNAKPSPPQPDSERAPASDSTDTNSNAARVQFLEADSQALPFTDNTFQCVTVAFGLRNVTDTDLGLREMTRVCRPGGQVMVLEFSRPQTWGLRQTYGFYFQHVLPKIGQWFARNDKSAYQYLPESVSQFPDGQALADRFTQAGLIDVSFTPLTCGVATIYEGTKPDHNRSDFEQ